MADVESGRPAQTEKDAGTRRDFLGHLLRGAAAAAIGGIAAILAFHRRFSIRPDAGGRPALSDRLTEAFPPGHSGSRVLWQIDPLKCIQCGRCATECVLDVSAVKCVHDFAMCGYCELCLGFFRPNPNALTSAAENQMCPLGAIRRRFVEDPYFEYVIDETRCIGCGKCVKGCTGFGNGSLYLQVRHDRCLNCNECSIAVRCPAGAFMRIPDDTPYLSLIHI
ncbi:MAG: hypothetical protein N3A38_16930, partial [Planctomycetota bacterium]|nr:hypothetical protein [Planctomycetota bacterium]